jgi:transposase
MQNPASGLRKVVFVESRQGQRLERGRFVWPQATTGTAVLSAAQLSMLLEGIDWRRPVKTWQPEVAA